MQRFFIVFVSYITVEKGFVFGNESYGDKISVSWVNFVGPFVNMAGHHKQVLVKAA